VRIKNIVGNGNGDSNGKNNGRANQQSNRLSFGYYPYDITEVKDERGQTILHLAAAKHQRKSTFAHMLSQAEYLIPERDAKYRTIRDIAVQSGMTDNMRVIDQYVIQSFITQNVKFVKHLSQEGFDILLTVVDTEGHDVIEMLKRQCHDVEYMMGIVQDIAQFKVNQMEILIEFLTLVKSIF
jgi:hypothetical protein